MASDPTDFQIEFIIKPLMRGEWADCKGEEKGGKRSRRRIEADFLRDLALGRYQHLGPLDPRGIRIRNASIIGRLDLEDCRIEHALSFDNCLFIGNDHQQPQPDKAVRTAIILRDAETRGVAFRQCRISGRIDGERLKNQGSLTLWNSHLRGECCFRGATIEGPVNADFAFFNNTGGNNAGGRAIVFDRADLNGECSFIGATIFGTFRLVGAHIRGRLNMGNAQIDGYGRRAIIGQRATITGEVFLDNCTTSDCLVERDEDIDTSWLPECEEEELATETRVDPKYHFLARGGVFFDDADLKSRLQMIGSKIESACTLDPASGDLLPRNRDRGRHIKKHDIERNDLLKTRAISLTDARIGRLIMPDEDMPEGIVDLTGAKAVIFEDDAAAWPSKTDVRAGSYLRLNNFSYDRLNDPRGGTGKKTYKIRTKWLEAQSLEDLGRAEGNRHFKPQPWTQLAACLDTQGHIVSAQEIRKEYRRQRRRVAYSWINPKRWQSQFLDWFAGYGFAPWRTVLVSLFSIALFALVWWRAYALCGTHDYCEAPGYKVLVPTNVDEYRQPEGKPGQIGPEYPKFNPALFSLDIFIPVAGFGYQDTWMPNLSYDRPVTLPLTRAGWTGIWREAQDRSLVPPSGTAPPVFTASTRIAATEVQLPFSWGQLLTAAYVFEIIWGLIMTSLIVTGFTGYLRREE